MSKSIDRLAKRALQYLLHKWSAFLWVFTMKWEHIVLLAKSLQSVFSVYPWDLTKSNLLCLLGGYYFALSDASWPCPILNCIGIPF